MKRYYREVDENIYDRKTGITIIVNTERLIGDHYYVNENEEQKVIHRDDIEEKR